MKLKLSLDKHLEVFFGATMADVSKELSASRVECWALRLNRDEALSQIKDVGD